MRAGEASAWGSALTGLRNALTHPLVLALAAALLMNALGLSLPSVVGNTVKLLAQASSGVALFAIGGMLTALDLRSAGAKVAFTLVGKLLAMPALALGLVFALEALGLPPLVPHLQATVVLLAALPTFSILPAMASIYRVGPWTTASMMGGTALSFVTPTGWMALLVQLGWL